MEKKRILNKVKLHKPSILGHELFSKYAVLLPLVEKENEIHILFEVRSQKMRRQPGEICFPGGRIDAQDQSAEEAAIRETTEELGIKKEQICHIYPLDYLVSPYGMMVYPYTAFINEYHTIQLNQNEVEEYFTVPLSFLHNTQPNIYVINTKLEPEKDFPFELIPGGENYNWTTRKMEEVFYIFEDKVIWGLTARILKHFLEMTRETIE